MLDDQHIDHQEQAAIERLAATLGISSERRQEANRSYLASIITAAKRDGITTAAEQRIIGQVADALGGGDTDTGQACERPRRASRKGPNACIRLVSAMRKAAEREA